MIAYPGFVTSGVPPTSGRIHQFSLLLVDDDEDFLALARHMLGRMARYRIDTYRSARDALEDDRLSSYDAIVSDYLIPGMDGIAFLTAVREQQGDIPFILLTGRGCEDVAIRAINGGADGYLQKIDNPDLLFSDLDSRILQAIRRKQSDDALRESEQKLNTFFQSSPVGLVIVSGVDGTFVDVNDYFLQKSGYTREEMIGKTAQELGLFADAASSNQFLHAIRYQQPVKNLKIRCRNRTGEVCHCLITADYVSVRNMPQILTTIVDITEHEEAADANQVLLRAMVGTSGIESLPVIASTISSWLHTDAILIGEIEPDRRNIRMLCRICDGRQVPGESCLIAGTPFESVMERGESRFLDHTGHDFAALDSWCGFPVVCSLTVPLVNSSHDVMGMIALLFRTAPSLPDAAENIIGVIAVKVAADIERSRFDRELQDHQEKLGQAMDLAHMATWEYDVPSGIFTFNDRFYELFNTTAEKEGGYRMSGEEYSKRFLYPEDVRANLAVWKSAIETTNPAFCAEIEHRGIRGDGEVRHILARFQTSCNSEGRTVTIHGANQDITESRIAEMKVQSDIRSLEYLSGRAVGLLDLDRESDIFRFIGDTIHALSPPGTVVIINEADLSHAEMITRAISGLTPEHQEILGDFASTLMGRKYPISPSSLEYVISDGIDEYPGGFRALTDDTFPEEVYRRVEETGCVGSVYGARLAWKDHLAGSVVLVLSPGQILENRFHIEIFTRLAAIELQRRQFERDLQEERSLFVSGPVVAFRWGSEENWPVRYVSPNIAEQCGHSADLLMRTETSYLSLIHPDDVARFTAETIGHAEAGRDVCELEYRLRRCDGEYRWVYDYTHIERDETGSVTSYHGYILDINERKQVEAQFRESQENAVALINANKESVFMMKPDGTVLFVNETAAARIGYSPADMLGHRAYDFVNPEIGENRRKYVNEVLKTKKPYFTLDERQGRIIENYLYPVLDESGDVVRIAVYGRDITDQEQALRKIRESEERYRVLAESSGDAIFIQDPDGIIRYANHRAVEMIGLSPDQIVGKDYYAILSSPQAMKEEELLMKVLQTRQPASTEMELDILGEIRWVEVQVHPIFSPEDTVQAVMGSVRDITERKHMEMSLRQAIQKLKFLTGITRHDVINDLNIILVSLDQIRTDPDRDRRDRHILRAMEAGEVLQRTINFTREYEEFGSISGQWTSLCLIIRQACREMSVPDTDPEYEISSDIEVFTDPVIRKVFTTLLDNSYRHGKRVSGIHISARSEGDSLMIVYEDDGIGIPDAEKERIFDHGFGKNTGIGLFLSREILSIMGMTIRETGVPGKGARFEIMVPKGYFRISPPAKIEAL